MSGRPLPAASLEALEAILRCPATYELAETIPDKGPVGRPRSHPRYMWVLYLALVSVWRSARQVEAELAHPYVWAFIRTTVRVRPDRETGEALPVRADPDASLHVEGAKATILTVDDDPAVSQAITRDRYRLRCGPGSPPA